MSASLASVAAGRSSHVRRQPRSASCALIAFSPNSDDIAFDIKTFGITCATGHSVAKASAPSAPTRTRARVHRRRVPLPGHVVRPVGKWYEHYVCRSGATRVVFDRG